MVLIGGQTTIFNITLKIVLSESHAIVLQNMNYQINIKLESIVIFWVNLQLWHYNLGAMLFCIIPVLLKYVKLELCSDNFRESRNFFFCKSGRQI